MCKFFNNFECSYSKKQNQKHSADHTPPSEPSSPANQEGRAYLVGAVE